jgi:hypothetical protein
MKAMKQLIIIILLAPMLANAQSSQVVLKERNSFVFAQIFGDFRYAFNKDYKPSAAFNFNQGIFGYYHKLTDNLSGKIMYDVTRTTNIYEAIDSTGVPVNINYFEGSKYTAYLKLAEIRWDVTNWFTFHFGQLLNTQYLTFIDLFWGYRYIDVTFQERYRLGNPADFGAQFDFKLGGKIATQFSVVNGEGPFRYQDLSGEFIYSANIQYAPIEGLTLKLYADIGPSPDTNSIEYARSVFSWFTGYKNDKYRIGFEAVLVNNYDWNMGQDHYGISVYGGYKIWDKITAIVRYDRLMIRSAGNRLDQSYYIAGFDYEPLKFFNTSLNFRYFSEEDLPFIFASFGLRF